MRYKIIFIVAAILFTGTPVMANVRNNDANAMIYGGAYSKDELVRKMTQGDGHNSGSNIRALFNRYDVKPGDIRSSNTVNGQVKSDGSVWIGQKKVATNAYTYGRQNMPGSTRQGSLYKRPASAALQSNSLPAYVHTANGKFEWAIIKSCGNMVTANPVAAKKTVAPAPAPVVQQTVVQQVVYRQVTQPAAPKALPQTGLASNIELIAAIAAISGSTGFLIYSRQRVRRSLLRSA